MRWPRGQKVKGQGHTVTKAVTVVIGPPWYILRHLGTCRKNKNTSKRTDRSLTACSRRIFLNERPSFFHQILYCYSTQPSEWVASNTQQCWANTVGGLVVMADAPSTPGLCPTPYHLPGRLCRVKVNWRGSELHPASPSETWLARYQGTNL